MEQNRFAAPAAGNPFGTPTVLLFHFTDRVRLHRVRTYLSRAGIRCVEVPPADLSRPLGAVLGLPGFPDGPADPGPDLDEEVLVMFAFREGMLDDLLRFFRAECPPTVGLKAVATPTNLLWTPRALFDELKQERAWFEQNACPTSAPIQA